MLKWWFRYSIPLVSFIIFYVGFLKIKKIDQKDLTCAYETGKYQVVLEAELKKEIALSEEQIVYVADIGDKCVSSDKKVEAILYFESKNFPVWMAKKIVVGRLYVNQQKKIKLYVKQWFDVDRQEVTALQSLYAHINNKIRFLSDTDFSLIQAAVFARKQYLSSEVKTLFRRLGIGHLLVVSGIHFALIVLSIKNLFLMLMYLNISLIHKWRVDLIDFFVSSIIGAGYLCLIDFPVSAQRAYIFIVLSKLMHSLGVVYSMYSVLFCSALIILIFDQQQIETLSFLYSFVCVLAILLFYQKNKRYYASLKLSIGVFCFSQVLTCLIFSSLNPIAWLLNLMLVPIFSIILVIYCVFTLGFSLLNSPALIELLAKQLYRLNGFFLKFLKYLDGLGAHEIKFENNFFIYNILFSMLCMIVVQILYKSRVFYKRVH